MDTEKKPETHEKVEGSEVKKIEHREKKGSTLTDTIRKNPWVLATVVLAIVTLILLIGDFSGGITGAAVGVAPKTDVETKVMDFVKSQVDGNVSLVSTQMVSGLYEVTISLDGREIPLYVTADGKNLVQGVTPLDALIQQAENQSTTAPAEVPKSDKPIVEAFVFSYCPYGLQFEKALSPVYTLLKTKADINIVYIGAMHGDYERVESLRQLCIQKNYGKDKLWQYLDKFNVDTNIGACNGDNVCLTPLIEKIFTQLAIDKNKINTCMSANAETLYNADVTRANELGISGSPTFVINGVQVSVGRTADAIKQAVCNAFNTVPTECSKALSTASASAGFGSSSSSSSSTASC